MNIAHMHELPLSMIGQRKSQCASFYDWFSVDLGDTRVGKMRVKDAGNTLTIYSIQIFPEFQNQGLARRILAYLKEGYDMLIADRVRPTARGFWQKMGFVEGQNGEFVYGTHKEFRI